MLTIKRLIILIFAAFLFAGCHTITNLTPANAKRNPNGVYPIEVKFDHREQALRKESIRPFVVINNNFYPMDKTRRMKNRWETLVPVPADQGSIHYRFKFEYEVNAIPEPIKNSKLSESYKLTIKDN